MCSARIPFLAIPLSASFFSQKFSSSSRTLTGYLGSTSAASSFWLTRLLPVTLRSISDESSTKNWDYSSILAVSVFFAASSLLFFSTLTTSVVLGDSNWPSVSGVVSISSTPPKMLLLKTSAMEPKNPLSSIFFSC